MAEMDPIIRDALKRTSQMQGFGARQQPGNTKKQEQQKPIEETKQEQSHEEVETSQPLEENPLNFLFKNKEQSIILLLVVLLMNENNDPMLLMALMYLLI